MHHSLRFLSFLRFEECGPYLETCFREASNMEYVMCKSTLISPMPLWPDYLIFIISITFYTKLVLRLHRALENLLHSLSLENKVWSSLFWLEIIHSVFNFLRRLQKHCRWNVSTAGHLGDGVRMVESLGARRHYIPGLTQKASHRLTLVSSRYCPHVSRQCQFHVGPSVSNQALLGALWCKNFRAASQKCILYKQYNKEKM